ncbi:MAG: hypothetical protein HQ538_01595, partial [Parcubacteria group bacterium]|nr:hypothetical protein [Parcubacteria group bacterium]
MPNVIVKSPTGQTRSVDVGQVQGFLNQNWTQQGATTEKMGVVSDPNPIAPKPQVVNPKAGLTEVDKQFREAVVPKAEAFANAPVGPAGEDARQIAANTPVVAASGQPELEQALKVRANNLGVPETGLSDMMDFPKDTIDTEEIEKDPVDLTGVFSDTTISNNIDKTVNLGLNSVDSTLMNLFKKQQASAEDTRIKMEQD